MHLHRSNTLPFLVLLLSAFSTQAIAEFDVAGLKLGMTEPQVIAALKAYDSSLKISSLYGYFSYFDGVNHGVRTPEFLDRIETLDKTNRKEFEVQFSGPPGTPKVIGIKRDGLQLENPPTPAQFSAALVSKYGNPTLTAKGRYLWDEPSKPQCNRRAPNLISNLMFNLGNTEKAITAGNPKHLPPNLENCGAFMAYQYPDYQAVKGFIVYVTDVGGNIQSERKSNEWVDSLEKKGQSKTQSNGKVPKL